jgi:hypothetical protein
MTLPRAALVPAALVVVTLGGCGGDDGASTTASARRLTPDERLTARHAERAIYGYCRRLARFAQGKGRKLPVGARSSAYEGVGSLTSLMREKPFAPVSTGLVGQRVDLYVHVGDIAEDLQGANCDPAIVDRIDQALGSVDVSGGAPDQ